MPGPCPGSWHGAEGLRRVKIPRQHFGETAASPASTSGEHTGRGILREAAAAPAVPCLAGAEKEFSLQRASDGGHGLHAGVCLVGTAVYV